MILLSLQPRYDIYHCSFLLKRIVLFGKKLIRRLLIVNSKEQNKLSLNIHKNESTYI